MSAEISVRIILLQVVEDVVIVDPEEIIDSNETAAFGDIRLEQGIVLQTIEEADRGSPDETASVDDGAAETVVLAGVK